MSMLHVEQVTHSYGDKIVFHQIGFRLVRGEHAGLVGSNGAGKSTLLRILAGELIPDAGRIDWLPHIQIGYLQQHTDLESGTTILQYLQTAFAHLYEIEQAMMEAAERMAAADGRLEHWLTRYGELQNRLELAGFYGLNAKIEQVAAGLGLAELGLDRDVGQLSGGQRTKLLLGRLLLEEPDVLLLDEPTNYLDDSHIDWLIEYLQSYEHAYLVISHDERFLNVITSSIYHLEHRTIQRYAGNYANFLKTYEQNKEQLHNAYIRQQKEIDRLESFIQKNKIRKAKQAKSREKALDKMERIERPNAAPRPRFSFSVHAEPVTRVMEASGLTIGYREPLLAPMELQIRRGDKIAVIGYNGVGKSTLLRTLLGYLQPIDGVVLWGERVAKAYYAQEELAPEETPLELLLSYRTDLTQKDIRQALAMSGLTEQHIRQRISSLSGGEQAKVRLCRLMLTACNVLVLDEPTNHLDARAKEAFKQSLQQYKGTIVLVSHEPDFYADWVTQVWNVQDWSRK
ncbi:ABC-F family ATP-binding cassette domain-containing protein [Paenibacillus sp. NPDC056579]|uniref:ABC-F family ATP-binding cassette domain-containing protein n=1 Tax=Paenibacillus sp. NPDC056579 TaxID=3345871 RepID=UPI00367C9946